MRKDLVYVVFAGLVFYQFLTMGTAWAAREHPIMRPGVDSFHAWVNAYQNAPVAAIDPIINLKIMSRALASAESSFSLLDNLVYTPSERDQGSCGNCWVWAGTGLLEVALADAGISDRLSIQLFDSCASLDCSDAGCGSSTICACGGGDLSAFVTAYNTLGYAVPWSNTNAQYQDSTQEDYCGTARACASITKNPSYALTREITESKITTQIDDQETAIANIKNILQQHKGVYFIFTLPNTSAWNDFYDFWDDGAASDLWDFSTYTGKTLELNDGVGTHAVLLVGYNEDDTDQAKHYWIAVNSWGTTTKRADGTFRIKMYQEYDSTYDYYYLFKRYTSPVMQFETIDNISFTESITTSPSEDIQISSNAYSGTIDIIAASTTAWSAVFDASWISFTSSATGAGEGQIAFTATANTSSEARTAQLYINDAASIRVIQAGASSQSTSDTTADPGGSSGGGGGGLCFIASLSIF